MSSSLLVREHQQKKLLTVLRRAQGADLTYDELREAGIEFPAVAVSELQLAGVPVERHYRRGRLQPSFRLAPEHDTEPSTAAAAGAVAGDAAAAAAPTAATVAGAAGPTAPVAAPTEARESPIQPHEPPTQPFEPQPAVESAPLRDRHERRAGPSPALLLSGVALLAAAVTVAVLVLSSMGPGRSANRAAAHRTTTTARAARHRVPSHRERPRAPKRVAPRPPASQAPAQAVTNPVPTATRLEAQGHELLQQGEYASAIPVLEQATRATGETPSACAQPTTPNCLTYAFALYDLGRALRLSGNPAAAVPILQQRLEINNQRAAVASELRLAQGAATSGASAASLEARGHSLLESGQYSSAVPVLQQAAQATGESPGACAQPTSQRCLTYAFALYDLGRALRLSGHPAAAVPILQQRLLINNQRAAVAQELQLAQAASP